MTDTKRSQLSMTDYERRLAQTETAQYFENLLTEIERLRNDVAQYQERSKQIAELDDGLNWTSTTNPDILDWCVNRTKQFDSKADQALKAACRWATYMTLKNGEADK